MKKTLVALAVAAFATSASAVTIYDNDGSKVDFNGSIRLLLQKDSSKEDGETTKRAHSNLHNDGSRFGVTVKHNLAEDFFATGRLEFRFNGGNTTSDKFGDLYAHRAYVGLGSKQYGELTFGRQVTIGDDIAQSDFANQYGVWSTTLVTSGKSVVRYDYKGIEGLQIGVGYRFAENRDSDSTETALDKAVEQAQWNLDVANATGNADLIATATEALAEAKKAADAYTGNGEVTSGKAKSGYDVGVTYGFKVAEGQDVKLTAGYSRTNFVTATNSKHHKDAWAAGASYKVNALTLGVDYAGSFEKKATGAKERANGFRVGAKYQVTPAVAVYGGYGYGVIKAKNASGVTKSNKHINGFLLGSSYQIHKNVFTYVEGSINRTKTTSYNGTTGVKSGVSKATDKTIGVGLRVSF